MNACKFNMNNLECLNELRDNYCPFSHDEFCKKIYETASKRKLRDEAIILYMLTQSDIEEEEIREKYKTLRFFKGKLSEEEKKDYDY